MKTRLQRLRDFRREAERLRDAALRPRLPRAVHWVKDYGTSAGVQKAWESRQRANTANTTPEQEEYLNRNGLRSVSRPGVTHEVLGEHGEAIAQVNLQGASRAPHDWSPNELQEFRAGYTAAPLSTAYRGEAPTTAQYALMTQSPGYVAAQRQQGG